MTRRSKPLTGPEAQARAEVGEHHSIEIVVQKIRRLAHRTDTPRPDVSLCPLENAAIGVRRHSSNIFGHGSDDHLRELEPLIGAEMTRAFETACMEETADMILREVDRVDTTGQLPDASKGSGEERWRVVVDAVLDPRAGADRFAIFRTIGFEWPAAMQLAHQNWHRFDEIFRRYDLPADPLTIPRTRGYQWRIRHTFSTADGILAEIIRKATFREQMRTAGESLRKAHEAVDTAIADVNEEQASRLVALRDSLAAESARLDDELRRIGFLVDSLGGLERRGARNHIRALVIEGLAEVWRDWKGVYPTAHWSDAQGTMVSAFVRFAGVLFVAAGHPDWRVGLGDAVKRLQDPWLDKLRKMLPLEAGKVAYADLVYALLGVDSPADLEPGRRASLEALMRELMWQGPAELVHPTRGPIEAFANASKTCAADVWLDRDTLVATEEPVAVKARGEMS